MKWYHASHEHDERFNDAGDSREEAIADGLVNYAGEDSFAIGHEGPEVEFWEAVAQALVGRWRLEEADENLAENNIIAPEDPWITATDTLEEMVKELKAAVIPVLKKHLKISEWRCVEGIETIEIDAETKKEA